MNTLIHTMVVVFLSIGNYAIAMNRCNSAIGRSVQSSLPILDEIRTGRPTNIDNSASHLKTVHDCDSMINIIRNHEEASNPTNREALINELIYGFTDTNLDVIFAHTYQKVLHLTDLAPDKISEQVWQKIMTCNTDKLLVILKHIREEYIIGFIYNIDLGKVFSGLDHYLYFKIDFVDIVSRAFLILDDDIIIKGHVTKTLATLKQEYTHACYCENGFIEALTRSNQKDIEELWMVLKVGNLKNFAQLMIRVYTTPMEWSRVGLCLFSESGSPKPTIDSCRLRPIILELTGDILTTAIQSQIESLGVIGNRNLRTMGTYNI